METFKSGLVVYNLIFRPSLLSNSKTNSIRELVKTFYGYGIPDPKVYVLPYRCYSHKIVEGAYFERLSHDKSCKTYKKLRKEHVLRGHIELCVLSNYDFSYLTNNMKPLGLLGNYCIDGGKLKYKRSTCQPIQTDVFVFCKNEKDNYCDRFDYVKKEMKKRMELYKKIEKRAMFRKHLEHHKRVICYSLWRLKQLNSSINLENYISNIIKNSSLENVKTKEFGKIYNRSKCQHSLGLYCCWGLKDTNNCLSTISTFADE